MKRMATLILILGLTLRMYGPEYPMLNIPEPINTCPHESLWGTTCAYESSNDPFACHLEENGCISVGIGQIQESRVIDYNAQTGSNYTLFDMFNDAIARKVFMFYASQFSPNQIQEITRTWNGGPRGMQYESTYQYYLNIKERL